MGKKGAFGRGQDIGGGLWGWRWVFVALLVLALLGKLAEMLELI